jgi:hypothetical protein
MNYKLLSYADVSHFIPEMERLEVSKVARSDRGFLTYYKSNPTLNEEWTTKRNAFLARTIPAYKKNPTYRRWLSIVAWAHYIKPLHI